MIMHVYDTLNVLCSDNSCLAGVFLQNNAAQMNDAVLSDDIQTAGAPVGFLDRMNNAITDVIVVGRWIGNMARKTRHRLKEIGGGDHPNDTVAANHGQSFDVVPFHEVRDVCQRCVFGDGERRRCHDFGDLPTVFVNEIAR